MQLFPIGKVYNFMGLRLWAFALTTIMVVGSIVLLFVPGPRLGTDFVGGTEVEVAFKKSTSPAEIKDAVVKGGFARPDVIKVEDESKPDRYLIRVQDVSALSDETKAELSRALCDNQRVGECQGHEATEVKFSPGGDKITVRFAEAPDLAWIGKRVDAVGGVQLRAGANNPSLQNARDHKVEVQLMSKGDQLMDALRVNLGPERVPEKALRTEWIGPKAGAQLRNAAIKSVAIALIFIMAYVAFRFDVRFAPGGVIALAHDAIVTIGVLIVLGKELNLTTVAAILTIIGYSVNDTVVVYDRVRENIGKLRGASFSQLINTSLSEMLSRTVLTSLTTIFSLLAFFVWGTGVLKDFSLTLVIGMVLGVFSSVYVALPVTEWLDRKFFSRSGKKKQQQKKKTRSSQRATAHV